MASKPSAVLMESARRLLAYERASGSAHECAAGAERVHDKLSAQLSVLLGPLGVQALFARSAKLAQGEFACLAKIATPESSTKLRECLEALPSPVAAEAAATLFATFLALVTSFIGERLTAEILHSAWPSNEFPPNDTKTVETRK